MMIKKSHPSRGQSLVEFALIIPLFAALAFFIFDFGRAVYYYSAIYNAAREGARYGVTQIYINVGLTNAIKSDIETVARERVYGITPSDVTVESSFASIDPTTKYLHVQTSYIFDPVIPIPIGEGTFVLASEAIMRIEPRVLP